MNLTQVRRDGQGAAASLPMPSRSAARSGACRDVRPTRPLLVGTAAINEQLGDKRYRYDPAQYLIVTAALPIASQIVEASPERPYLGLVLKLDPTLVGSVLVEAGHLASRRHAAVTAIDVSPLDAGLLDAVVRLVRLLDAPTDARFLAPLICSC